MQIITDILSGFFRLFMILGLLVGAVLFGWYMMHAGPQVSEYGQLGFMLLFVVVIVYGFANFILRMFRRSNH